jgi:hypothetical protein
MLAAGPAPAVARSIAVPGGAILVSIGPEPPSLPVEALVAWVGRCGRAIAGYYGRFPVARVRLTIETGGRGSIGNGTTWGGAPPNIRIAVGRAATTADLDDDWVLTHEMVHLAFPDMPERLSWVEEGLATYVEPVARARAGDLPAKRVWLDLVEGLPRGLPEANDRGLDHTHTWGRTYWGGALFWLLADVEIRERTGNRRGLEDALRGILAAGGTIEDRWTLARALAEGDRATGVAVLVPLHAKMGPQPMPMDLDDLWKRLGVKKGSGGVTFDEGAPLAAVRRAITRTNER